MSIFSLLLSASALLAAGAPAPELSVMSYNLRFGSANDGPDAWDLRRDRLAALVREYDPDIIGTQECLDFQAQYLADQLPHYAWIGLGRQENATGEMTAILYRKDALIPLESGHFWLSESPDIPGSKSWDSSLPRIASWVKFYRRATGRTFFFYNTHFDHRGEQARLESARLLASRIGERHAGEFVVITGDFNANAETSAPWKALAEGGLLDAWNEAAVRAGDPNTWNGFAIPSPERYRRIDWILVTPGARVTGCAIDGRHENGRFPSDHMPVIARITPPDSE